MKLHAGRAVKVGNFMPDLKAFSKLILHKPAAVVDCSRYRLVFLLSRTDKYKKKQHLAMSNIRNISIFALRLVFPEFSNLQSKTDEGLYIQIQNL